MLNLNYQSGITKTIFILASRIIIGLVGIVFIPLYVKYLGKESYGLVAFYGTLIASLSILDLGLSTAISRQIAVLSLNQENRKNTQDLVFTIELIYWSIAIILCIAIIFTAHFISNYWIQSEVLDTKVITNAVMLMGSVVLFQFPISIYNGIMIGLEKQVQNAFLNVLFSIFKALGVILALHYIQTSIECYFIWQVVMTFLLVISLRIYVWKKIRVKEFKPIFSKTQLKSIWKFAAGITGISLITFFLTTIDKIILSKMVLLEYIGYYNIAFMVASLLTQIISPIQPIIFPKLTKLIASNQNEILINLYHKTCRWIALIVFPIALTLILFAKEILFIWTNDINLTENTYRVMQIIVTGTALNCLMWMPYLFLLAKGNTKFTIIQNLIAVVLLFPLLIWWTNNYGIIGASFVWLSVNCGYVLISIPVFHKLFLKEQLFKWYFNDTFFPLLISGILFGIGKYIQFNFFPSVSFLLLLVIIVLCSAIYLIIIPDFKKIIKEYFSI